MKRPDITPGPWEASQPEGGNIAIIPVKRRKFGESWTLAYLRDFQSNDAENARMMAAAPAMAEALENLVKDWERVHGPIPHDHEAKAALTLAGYTFDS